MDRTEIPILDLSPEIEALWEEFQAAIQGVLRSGHFIMGPNVGAFEAEIGRYLNVRHAVAVNSGTDALYIALRSLNIGSGDEVITTPFTFFATAEAISHIGAVPIFVDIDPTTYNLDPDLVEKAITRRTKAIIPVHLFGHSADLDPLLALSLKYGLAIIEDVAQAFGSEYKGRKLGTIGTVGAYSFFPSKNLGAFGDAGLLVTNDDNVAELARMLRSHGSKKKYYNELVGYNSRLDELQAAILRVKLPHIDSANAGRRKAAMVYNQMLTSLAGLVAPSEMPYTKHVYHQYTIRVLDRRRDEVKERLAASGIMTMVYYPCPVHKLPVYASIGATCFAAETAAEEVLSLPIWPTLDEQVQRRVVQGIIEALK